MVKSVSSPVSEVDRSHNLALAASVQFSPASHAQQPSVPDVEASGWDYPRQRPSSGSLLPSALPSASSPGTGSTADQHQVWTKSEALAKGAEASPAVSTHSAAKTSDSQSTAPRPGENGVAASNSTLSDARGTPSSGGHAKAISKAVATGKATGSPAALRLSSASPSALVNSLRPTGGTSPAAGSVGSVGSPAGDATEEEMRQREERQRRAADKRALFLQQQSAEQKR